MKLIDELLGFAVLTGPLWLILVLLPLALWVAVKVSRRFAPGRTRFLAGAGIFALVFLVPFADEIAGRLYFSYLCATQAGVKVYQTVELPGEYWDEKGRARFYAEFDSLLGSSFARNRTSAAHSFLFHIDKSGYEYLRSQSQQVLGEAVDFLYWGGWIKRNLSTSNSADSCIDYRVSSNRLIDRIFVPQTTKPE